MQATRFSICDSAGDACPPIDTGWAGRHALPGVSLIHWVNTFAGCGSCLASGTSGVRRGPSDFLDGYTALDRAVFGAPQRCVATY